MSEQSHLWAIAYDDVGRADQVCDEIKRLVGYAGSGERS
jgi:hypothetical protein